MVKLYSRPLCGPCYTMKYWLKKNKVDFEEVDATNLQMIVPLLEIDGTQFEQPQLKLTHIKELLSTNSQ